MKNFKEFVHSCIMLNSYHLQDGMICRVHSLKDDDVTKDYFSAEYARHKLPAFIVREPTKFLSNSKKFRTLVSEVQKLYKVSDGLSEEIAFRIIAYTLGMHKSDSLVSPKQRGEYKSEIEMVSIIRDVCSSIISIKNDLYSSNLQGYINYYGGIFDGSTLANKENYSHL